MFELVIRFEEQQVIGTEMIEFSEHYTSWIEARQRMEFLIFNSPNVISVMLVDPGECLIEMSWTYTSEDGTHPLEYSVDVDTLANDEHENASLQSEHFDQHVADIIDTLENTDVWQLAERLSDQQNSNP